VKKGVSGRVLKALSLPFFFRVFCEKIVVNFLGKYYQYNTILILGSILRKGRSNNGNFCFDGKRASGKNRGRYYGL
jgi:hypothetical protein